MAKQSPIRAITRKQSSAYKNVPRTTHSMIALDGSSKREVSRYTAPALKSFSGASSYASESMKDAQAERAMNPHGYSNKRNPICPSCFSQKSNTGACGCSE